MDIVIRGFHGSLHLLNTAVRSIELLLHPALYRRVIVVMDADEVLDHQMSLLLPAWVSVYYEDRFAFMDLWEGRSTRPGWLRGMWSNFVSDRYSDSEFIALWDGDMVLGSRGQLPLSFDWDESKGLWRPVLVCHDRTEPYFVESTYSDILGLTEDTAPGCMYQLPVILRRDTFPLVRQALIDVWLRRGGDEQLRQLHQAELASGNGTWTDRDAQLPLRLDLTDAATDGRADTSRWPTSAFDRAYALHLSAQTGDWIRICQFCLMGAYVVHTPHVASLYSVHLLGTKSERSECPLVRAGAHLSYMRGLDSNSQEKKKQVDAYFHLASEVLDSALCHSSTPSMCNAQYCKKRGWHYDALATRRLYEEWLGNVTAAGGAGSVGGAAAGAGGVAGAGGGTGVGDGDDSSSGSGGASVSAGGAVPAFSYPASFFTEHEWLLGFEFRREWWMDARQPDPGWAHRCWGVAVARVQAHYEYVQQHDPAPLHLVQHQCNADALALTQLQHRA